MASQLRHRAQVVEFALFRQRMGAHIEPSLAHQMVIEGVPRRRVDPVGQGLARSVLLPGDMVDHPRRGPRAWLRRTGWSPRSPRWPG